MASAELDAALSVALGAATAAGELIKAGFKSRTTGGHQSSVTKSSPQDLVTQTDTAAEKVISDLLLAAFPSHAFVGEEGVSAANGHVLIGDGPTWVVDPLDGTTNFVHSFPFVCVSIALVVNRQPVVAVVHAPILNETFYAVKGGGAFLNAAPIRASGCDSIGSALVGTELGTTRDAATVAAIMGRLTLLATAPVRSIRAGGSCALGLAGVAAGRLDAFFEVGFGGPWDCAAGVLLVAEAGGCVADPTGGPFGLMSRRVLAASTPALQEAISAVLRRAPASATEPPAV